jgi:hypothetical protein
MQMSQAALDNSMSQLRLEESKETRKIRQKEHELSLKNFELNFERIETDKRAEAAVISSIQVGQAKMRQDVLSDDVIRGALKQGGPVAARLRELGEIGFADGGKIGNTTSDAYFALNAHNGKELQNTDNSGAAIMGGIASDLAKSYETSRTGAPKGKDANEKVKADYDALVKTKFEEHDASIKTGDASNPNHAPPLESLKKYKAVTDTIFYKTLLADVEVDNTDPEFLTKLGIQALQDNKLSMPFVINGLTTIYQAAATYNNANDQRERYNLPMQSSYNAVVANPRKDIPAVNLFTAGPLEAINVARMKDFITVNMMDEASVANYITQIISSGVGPDAANFELQ